eukprot:2822318-Pleurochrysis_carterae.AAC.1
MCWACGASAVFERPACALVRRDFDGLYGRYRLPCSPSSLQLIFGCSVSPCVTCSASTAKRERTNQPVSLALFMHLPF